MKAQIIKANKDTPGCDFEQWDKELHSMKKCGNDCVATIGKSYVCIDHLAHVLLCSGALDMYETPEPGKKIGQSIFSKEDFLRIARINQP